MRGLPSGPLPHRARQRQQFVSHGSGAQPHLHGPRGSHLLHPMCGEGLVMCHGELGCLPILPGVRGRQRNPSRTRAVAAGCWAMADRITMAAGWADLWGGSEGVLPSTSTQRGRDVLRELLAPHGLPWAVQHQSGVSWALASRKLQRP